jgi:hypothetical protein
VEDFEGGTTQDWVSELGGANPISLANWDATDFRSDAGSFSAGCAVSGDDAPAAGGPYPVNMESWLIRGPFDLGKAVGGTLSFRSWLQSSSGSDWLSWMVSTDGENFSGLQDSGGTSGWVDYSLDLEASGVAGEPKVWIAFAFTSDGDPSGAGEGAYIDEILLQIAQEPDIRLSQLQIDVDEEWEAPTEPPGGGPAPAEPYSYAQEADQLAGIAAELSARSEVAGPLRVIVGVDAPFQLAGRLSAAQAQLQRNGIASAQTSLLNRLAGLNVTELARFRNIPFQLFEADSLALKEMALLPQVVSIEEDVAEPPAMASSNPLIGSPSAWADGWDGAGQAVAVLDTGVDKTHPWFATFNKVVSEACYSTSGPSSSSFCPGGASSSTDPGSALNCPEEVNGCDHGTHVAGTVAGNDGAGPDFGVARGADIIAMQVFSRFDANGDCSGNAPCALAFVSDQVKALDRVFELRDTLDIAAVNMSLGGASYSDQSACDAAGGARKTAIDQLRTAGIAVIAASGNSGNEGAIDIPACLSSSVSVAASTDADALSGFSNVASFLDLLAPGSDINSALPGGGTDLKDGTSMAAPHVAGAWAVMRQKGPAASVDAILELMAGTGTSIDDLRVNGSATDMRRINLDLALSVLHSGQFLIFNDGDAPLDVSDISLDLEAEWLSWTPLEPFSVAPGEQQAVQLVVDWDLAPEGSTSRTLSISSNDPDESPYPGALDLTVITAVPAPEFYSAPVAGSLIDFGSTLLGNTSGPQNIELYNLGELDLTIDCELSGAEADMFSITQCPATLLPDSGDDVILSCTPTSGGAVTATLELNTNDADEGTVSFDLHCEGIAPEFNSTPPASSALNFGNVAVGYASDPAEVTLDNLGSADLNIGCTLSGIHVDEFELIQCPTLITPGGSSPVQVICRPSIIGDKTASLDLSTDDADESAVSYPLLCKGAFSEFDPGTEPGTTIDFGAVAVGGSSALKSIKITNLGEAALTVACQLSGDEPGQFSVTHCPLSIPGSSSEELLLTCIPTAMGEISASLDLATNDEDEGNVSYPLSCEGVAPEFDSSPVANSNFEFGDVPVNTSSAAVKITVFNTGVSNLTLACSLEGPEYDDFEIRQCASPVAPEASTEVQVVCKPTDAGNRQATLRMATNDADEGQVIFGLNCLGAEPEFDSEPAPGAIIDFGGVVTERVSEVQTVQVDNRGTADLTVSCQLDGGKAGAFRLAACPDTLPPGEDGIISLTCEPVDIGAISASLELQTNDPEQPEVSFELRCTGLSPLVINEVGTGDDYVELFNASTSPIGLEAFFLQATGCGEQQYGLTAYLLEPGAHRRLAEIDCWNSGMAGSVALIDIDTNRAVDFVRWGGSSTEAPDGTAWSGNAPAPPSDSQAIGRDLDSRDTDSDADWCVQNPSWNAVNLDCVSETELKNLSTRADVGVAHDIAIGGFIVSGGEKKCVLVRGRGPSMNVSGVPLLLNPTLSLYSGQEILSENDDWQDQQNPDDRQIIEDLGLAPADLREAAIYYCLDEGPYTALLRGVNGGTGLGIVEVFDADDGSSILKNISTRARVGTGPLVTIAGFIIEGNAPRRILIRGRGPTVGVPDGVSRLNNPVLRLYQLLPDNSNVLLEENDNWPLAANAEEIEDSGQAPGDSFESAILLMLDPGVYTGILDGKFGSTGSGIIEVIDLTDDP